MFFIEDDNFLKKEDIDYINNNIVYNDNFPMFLQHKAVEGDNNRYMCHTIVHRIEQRSKEEPEFNSFLGPYFLELLKRFCKKHKIKFNKILRSAINLSFKDKENKSKTHKDHTFKHKQMLIYLNQPEDKESKTVILDKMGKKILKEIKPEAYKVICFEDALHYMYFPKKGIRMIAITTFN